jgi:hypothetical protein
LSKLICAIALVGVLAFPAEAQTSAIPPDIQTLRAKLKAGQALTTQEEARLKQWLDSLSQRGATAPGAAATTAAPAAAAQSFCPPAGAALPAAAPADAELLLLLQTLVTGRAAKLDTATRQSLDSSLRASASTGASVAALLGTGGAVDEAVYTAAATALRNPADLIAINNLSVILSEAGDHRTSALMALYVVKKRPDSPLASVNLAWTYFNGGARAQAEPEFKRAKGLAPGLADPETGLGLLAACRGDAVNAADLLKAGLKKGYSQVAATAVKSIKRSQPPAPPATSKAELSGLPKGETGDPSKMIPDLKVSPEPGRNEARAESFRKLHKFASGRIGELQARGQVLAQQIASINRQATETGNALFLPKVFEKQMFQFEQIMDLAFASRFRDFPSVGQAAGNSITGAGRSFFAAANTKMPQMLEMMRQNNALMMDMIACGEDSACKAQVQKKMDALTVRANELSASICFQAKTAIDVVIGSDQKIWKSMHEGLRAAAPDLYAYTNPVLAEVFVPALNELMQIQREVMVLSILEKSAAMAEAIAEMDKGYRDLKCVQNPPPDPDESADPQLPEKASPPDCPLKPPLTLGVPGFAKITLGCDGASIERTFPGVRFKLSRDFKKHETTAWVGAGVGAGATPDSRFDALGSLSPKIGANAEVGVGIKIGKDGAVTDMFMTASVGAGASFGNTYGLSGANSIGMGASATVSLMNGAQISGTLPGGGSGGFKVP